MPYIASKGIYVGANNFGSEVTPGTTTIGLRNCKIRHSVVGLKSCISVGAIIEDTLLIGEDYYETDADRRFLAAKGSVPIGIGKNSHIKRSIIGKNARIGENVKVVNRCTFLHLFLLSTYFPWMLNCI